MKKIYSYIAALGAVLLLNACDSDLEKVTYNSAEAVPAALEEIKTSCVLENKKADEVALTLNWKAPKLNYSGGYSAAVTNYIEMDVAQNNFANKMTLSAATITDVTKSFTHGELNTNILKLLKDGYGMDVEKDPETFVARDFEFRIQSSVSTEGTPVYSNVITVNITPYSMDIAYPEIYVIGNYSSWGWDTAQSLFSFKENEDYEGVIDFSDKAQGFKITGAKDWNNGNYGASGDAVIEDEAAEITLINDGGSKDLSCYSAYRFYRFTFNTSTLVLKKNLSFNQLGVVGDAVGSWDNDVVMEFDAEKQRFYADVTLTEGEMKFRLDGTWTTSFGSSTEGLLDSGDNIKVPAGNYRVYVNLNNSTNQTYELNAEDYNK